MTNNKLKDISNRTIDRYTQRYNKLGKDIKTLGWGNKEQQFYRFKNTLVENIEKKSILDIGCGFADYLHFLINSNITPKKYIGYDINKHFIKESKKSFKKERIFEFYEKNILDTKDTKAIVNIGVMLGLLNYNLKNQMDNYEYSKKFIKKAFSLVDEVLIVDFLSTKLTPEYPKEDFVFYHDPIKMLEFAFTLSDNVVLKHNYTPIPQKEFMLFIYKE